MCNTKLFRPLFYIGALLSVSVASALPVRVLPGLSVADLVKASQTGDDGIRGKAIMTLGMYDVPEARSALVAALGDSWFANRFRAAEGLGKIGRAGDIDPLLARLKIEVKWEKEDQQSARGQTKHYQGPRLMGSVTTPEFVQYEIVSGIREILQRTAAPGADEARLKVVQAMSDPSQDDRVRAWMALTLGQLADKRSVPTLIDVLRDESSGFLRALSAKTLGNLGATEAIPALRAALDDPYVTPDGTHLPRVRNEASRALDKIEHAR